MNILKDKNVYACILLCFLAGIASFGVCMYQNEGIFTVAADFNLQQIPFLTSLNAHFKKLAGTWCWNVDLGTQLVGAYGFYNLGSPFVWITFLFPKSAVPYLMGWMYVLKYVVAGVTSYLYLRRFVRQRQYAVIGALLYAFSGFQSTNLLFFHFHDVVAFFPLMLIGLEELIGENKKALFIFSIFINCMINYFFFISEVIFLILYYIVRFWKKNFVVFLKDGLRCLVCGIVGTGMAAILFLPSVLYITGNSRTESSFELRTLFYYGGHLLLAVKGFLFPGEAMGNQSCVVPEYWYSASCYLPMVGGALTFAYMLGKKKDWLTKFLLLLWLISCSPAMNSAFYLFTEPYKRWWFMFTMMLSVATVMVLDDRENYPVKMGIYINVALLFLFCCSLLFLNHTSLTDEKVILRNDIFWYNCGIALVGLLVTWFWCAGEGVLRQRAFGGLLVCVVVFCSATTVYALSLYRQNAETGKEYLIRYRLGLQLKEYDSQYRYNLCDNVLTLTGEASGIGSFNSTVSNSINDFDMLFDFERQNSSMNPNSVPGLKELLAARYQVISELPQGSTAIDTLKVGDTNFYLIEESACPIGFAQSSYITEEELKQFPVNKRGIAMLDNLVVSGDDETLVSASLKHNDSLFYTENYSELPALVKRNQKNGVTGFKRDQTGFSCNISLDGEKAVFFSIPYDDGWTAMVDGVEGMILNSGGMMALLLGQGEHNVSFQYKVPGLRLGMMVSIICFCVFGIVFSREHRPKFSEEVY